MDGSAHHPAILPTTSKAASPSLSPASLQLTALRCLRAAGVTCCYWKSTGRLHAALSGEADLDLLVARQDQHRAQQILLAQGFKCFPAVASRDHPAISSFLGYDEASGRIIHLHLQFRLMLGAKLLKTYRLPWEETILARAVALPTLPVSVLDPATEALLMVVRSCLELRRTDPVALRQWNAASRRLEAERSALAARVDRATLQARAGEVFSADLANLVAEAFFAGKPLLDQGRLRRRVRSELADRRSDNAWETVVRSGLRALLWAAGGLNDRFLHLPRPWRRRVPGGGCVVAVLGLDGSGKTTVVAGIRTWLDAEIDVVPIYFGTGAGRPSLLLLPFKLMVPLVMRCFVARPRGASHGRVSDRPPGRLYGLLMMVWADILAVEKRRKLVAARRGAERGLVMLTDRYPQDQDLAYNDGPLLPRLERAPRWLRDFEARAYALARRFPPDLVIKLQVSEATAARREPDMDPAVIRARIDAVRRLDLPGARVVCVDAEQPLADVLRVVRREVWNLL